MSENKFHVYSKSNDTEYEGLVIQVSSEDTHNDMQFNFLGLQGRTGDLNARFVGYTPQVGDPSALVFNTNNLVFNGNNLVF